MPTFLYFAYGSNMMTARLVARCKSAKSVGLAFADGHRLTFWKASDDGSGKGHLVAEEGCSQLGVLFEISAAERDDLDEFEGVEKGYRRVDNFAVRRVDTGKTVETVTYIGTNVDQGLAPYDWYLALIVTGAREHGLGETVVEQMIATAHISDPRSNRLRRKEAIALLEQARTTIEEALAPFARAQ